MQELSDGQKKEIKARRVGGNLPTVPEPGRGRARDWPRITQQGSDWWLRWGLFCPTGLITAPLLPHPPKPNPPHKPPRPVLETFACASNRRCSRGACLPFFSLVRGMRCHRKHSRLRWALNSSFDLDQKPFGRPGQCLILSGSVSLIIIIIIFGLNSEIHAIRFSFF